MARANIGLKQEMDNVEAFASGISDCRILGHYLAALKLAEKRKPGYYLDKYNYQALLAEPTQDLRRTFIDHVAERLGCPTNPICNDTLKNDLNELKAEAADNVEAGLQELCAINEILTGFRHVAEPSKSNVIEVSFEPEVCHAALVDDIKARAGGLSPNQFDQMKQTLLITICEMTYERKS